MKRTLAILAVSLAFTLGAAAEAERGHLTYDAFVEQLREGSVSNVIFKANGMVVELAGGGTNSFVGQPQHRPFYADPLLVAHLEEAGIEPTFAQEGPASGWTVLLALTPLILWGLVPIATLVLVILIYRKLHGAPQAGS